MHAEKLPKAGGLNEYFHKIHFHRLIMLINTTPGGYPCKGEWKRPHNQ